MNARVRVSRDVLVWARETAGFSLEEAASKIGFNDTARMSAADKLAAIENGELLLTKKQLAKIASVYRRPLTVFYLSSPPSKGDRGQDFRTAQAQVTVRENALLDSLLRDVHARQSMIKSLIEEDDAPRQLTFVGSIRISNSVEETATKIVNSLFNSRETTRHAFSRAGGADAMFKMLRRKVEDSGVFVLIIGDLGSHHSQISESVFRGFAISDPIAPFIVINSHDAKPAYTFTLLHELVHIWLGLSGVSGSPSIEINNNRVERFCNDVASEILLPRAYLTTLVPQLRGQDESGLTDILSSVSQQFGVSEALVAYRLNSARLISDAVYTNICRELYNRWQRIKQAKKNADRENESGPNYYVVKQYKLGNALVDVVRRNLRDESITHTKAAKVLGVNPNAVEALVRNFEHTSLITTPPRGG